MKLSQQLRIGNLMRKKVLQRDEEILQINSENIFTIEFAEHHGDVHFYEPIAITPEWLDKLGFMYENPTVGGYEKWVIITPKNRFIKLLDKKFTWGEEHQFSDYIVNVHQLQNLYFALTGTELEIKL